VTIEVNYYYSEVSDCTCSSADCIANLLLVQQLKIVLRKLVLRSCSLRLKQTVIGRETFHEHTLDVFVWEVVHVSCVFFPYSFVAILITSCRFE
jgi:hypothetical protein